MQVFASNKIHHLSTQRLLDLGFQQLGQGTIFDVLEHQGILWLESGKFIFVVFPQVNGKQGDKFLCYSDVIDTELGFEFDPMEVYQLFRKGLDLREFFGHQAQRMVITQ